VPAGTAPTLVAPELPAAAQVATQTPAAAPAAPAAAAAPAVTAQDAATPAAQATAADAAPAEAPVKAAAPAERPAQAPVREQSPVPGAAHAAAPKAQEPVAGVHAQPAAAASAPAKAEAQPAAPQLPTAPVAAAPAAPATSPSAAAAAPQRAVPLHRAPAAVATLLHVAAERGITRAKMAVKPAELGGIEIRLQSTAAGVAAQVVADSPEAARLLAQAGDDLRRALEARDVTLISLEVSTSSDQQQASARGEWTNGDDAPAFGSRPTSSTGDADGDVEPTPTTHSVIELPGGLLVDVLA
jgi:flagellar hook-length control protein FliK